MADRIRPRCIALAVLACSAALAGAQENAHQQPPAAGAPKVLDYPALLGRMAAADWLFAAPAPGERCVQFSSYDRRSDAGPASGDDWYANDDRGHFLRVEERDGRPEHVLVDAAGPGAVVRIWSANPSGVLHFDVDGERVWTVDFAALTTGQVQGLGDPLAGLRARGANCHLPIPFQRQLKVTASANDFYYHVNVLHFAPETRVEGFRPELLQQHAQQLARLQHRLAGEVDAGQGGRGRDLAKASGAAARVEVPAGRVVRRVVLRVGDRPDDLGERLRRLLFVVACGGEETVRVPAGDFFGSPELKPFRSYFLAVDDDGTCRCTFPMPMPGGGVVALVADGVAPSLPLALEVEHEPLDLARPLLFRASWHSRKNFASRPFHDHLVLDAGGRGRFVGTSLWVKNPHRGWWGEGDEKFFVDGERFPSTFGTGTEDYFGYAWCCPQPFHSAFHAQPQADGPVNYGCIANLRLHLLDAVPFQRSFRFDLEVWHWVPGLTMDYATVAYWYGSPGASAGLPPMPEPDQRTIDRLPPPPMLVVAGALEGEALRVVSCSGGRHTVQDMSFLAETFSHDQQRWWMDGKPGDALVLAVPVQRAGRYRVRAALCRANDYGIVQLSLAGRPLGMPIDCYQQAVGSSGALDLGEVELRAGEVELELRLTGRNEAAMPRHMVGLDYLLLEPVR